MPTDGPSTPPPSPDVAPELPGAAPFPYMRFAKAHLSWEDAGAGGIGLGFSGVAPLAAADRAALGLAPPPEVGAATADLKAAIAVHHGVTPDHVHLAAGASHANFIVYLALARGGHVAVETPAYEALHQLAPAVGASCTTFRRVPEADWRLELDGLAAAVDDRTDLVVLTDLHNPSGCRLPVAGLSAAVDLAERHDAHVLVDEVYLAFDPMDRPSAVHRHPRVVVTGSLTKVHGLPDLRAGWVVAQPEVIARIESWDDLVHPALPPGPMRDAAHYLPQSWPRIEATRAQAAARAAQVDAWVATQPCVRWTLPHGGLTGFLLLDGLDGDVVAETAWRKEGVRVVPGSFFQVRAGLRISFLLPEDDLTRALEGLGRAIEACT